MQKSDTILVVIDPTKTRQHALDQAVILAQKLDKQLELFICTHDDSLKHYRNILGEEVFEISKTLTMEKLSGTLEAMAEPLRSKNLTVNCEVSWDWPLEEGIIRRVLQIKPFLVVKDTHYHSRLSRAILRNTDWGLIKNCPYPILFDKQIEKLDQPVIISCINPINEIEKDIDKEILALGKVVAKNLQGRHKIFHAYRPITSTFVGIGEGTKSSSLDEQNKEILNMHRNRVEALADDYGVDHEDIIFEQGEVKKLLLDMAENYKADVVLMGSRSRSSIKEAFVGSTAEAVLDELGCNVLVLKPKTFKTTVSEEAPPDYPPLVWPI